MKKQNGITRISLICIIAIIILCVILIKNFASNYYIENTKLTKNNFETTMTKYREITKENDDFYYVIYAELYYMVRDSFSLGLVEALTTGTTSDEVAYTNIYGKTIKELKEEGKSLMKKNNTTVKQFKNQFQNP